jgi:hypothetical protein
LQSSKECCFALGLASKLRVFHHLAVLVLHGLYDESKRNLPSTRYDAARIWFPHLVSPINAHGEKIATLADATEMIITGDKDSFGMDFGLTEYIDHRLENPKALPPFILSLRSGIPTSYNLDKKNRLRTVVDCSRAIPGLN